MFKTVPIPFDMIYSQHGSLKPQYMYLRRLYEPANADSSLIQKTFINTQLPPVTSLFFWRINGAIHYMYTIPLSTCKFILILLFSLVLQMKNQLIHRTSLSLQIQLILPWLFFLSVPQMINQLFHRVSKQVSVAWWTNSNILHFNKRQYCQRGGGWVIKSIQEPPTDRVMSWHEEFQHAPLFQDLHVHVEFPITSWAASEMIKPLPCFLGSLCHSLILSQHLHQHQVFLCSDLLLMF